MPPSRGFRSDYQIVHGHIDNLAALEPMRSTSDTVSDSTIDLRSTANGERDKKFWPYVARQAHLVSSLEVLIDVALELNELMSPPLSESEVVAKCRFWWSKTQKGENWYGAGRYVKTDHKLIDSLLMRDPDAFQLLMFLQRHHWARDFTLANETARLLPLSGSKRGQLGWDRERFAGARQRLIECRYLKVVRPASFKPNRPALYRLTPEAPSKLEAGLRKFPQ